MFSSWFLQKELADPSRNVASWTYLIFWCVSSTLDKWKTCNLNQAPSVVHQDPPASLILHRRWKCGSVPAKMRLWVQVHATVTKWPGEISVTLLKTAAKNPQPFKDSVVIAQVIILYHFRQIPCHTHTPATEKITHGVSHSSHHFSVTNFFFLNFTHVACVCL